MISSDKIVTTPSIQGRARGYGVFSKKSLKTGLTEIAIWVLAIVFVLGLDWLIMYLSTPNIPNIAV